MQTRISMGSEQTHEDPFTKAVSFMERVFGFRAFREGQGEVLEAVLEGHDTLVIMPTGGGKSLFYQVPAFISPGITLVISPLIALMKDQVDTLRVLDLPVCAVHSLMSLREQEKALREIQAGEIKLVYVSPERLRNHRFMEVLARSQVAMVAVDEAHCISQWGHDFRPDYLRISQALKALGKPQTIALTATATEKVRSDIVEHLSLRTPRLFITGFDRRNLFWEVAYVGGEEEKLALIKDRLNGLQGAGIVYTGTRKSVERIVQALQKTALSVEGYHGGMEKEERTRAQEGFMDGRIDLIVATNAFGMGIDRSDIRMILHHTFPGSIEAYYQESGRAGRDGEPAACLLLYAPQDRRLQEFFIESRYPPREVILEVYDRIRKRPEDLLWLTYREIGSLGDEKVPEMAVAACIQILEQAGAVMRLHRYDNLAELYLHQSPAVLTGSLPATAKIGRKLLHLLEDLYGEKELAQGIQFLPHELSEQADLPIEAVRRYLSQMDARGEATYIPPFRGRGLRVLTRVKPEEVQIDFDALQVRKAYELERLDQVVAYATQDGCRRSFLLHYFGERLQGDNCGACDLCTRRGRKGLPEGGEDPVLAVKVISGVARLKGRFGQGMAARVLTGSRDRMILQFGLHRLSTYGLLAEHTQAQVAAWIRELLSLGCISSRRVPVGEKAYPVLDLTERGYRVMAGRETIRLSSPERPGGSSSSGGPALQRSEKETFNRLRELRSSLARRESLPPYCIFHDRTLREMARTLPGTPEELLAIAGVGEVTLRKYGPDFLGLLTRIREEERKRDRGEHDFGN